MKLKDAKEIAKYLGWTWFEFTCKTHGDHAKRLVSNGKCCECAKRNSKKSYLNNHESRKERCRDSYWSDVERSREYQRSLPVNAESKAKAQRKYREANRDKYAYYESMRRASILQATPSWLSDEHKMSIRETYTECSTRGNHEVDHIVPLQGELVSGLHVPWNLQIIPAEDNRRKSNRWIL